MVVQTPGPRPFGGPPPPRVSARVRPSAPLPVWAVLAALALLAAGPLRPLGAQGDEPPPKAQGSPLADLLTRARQALGAENYQEALNAFTEGRRLFPEEPVFPAELGDLYAERRLHSLALEAYQAALALSPFQYDTHFKVAETLGLLNRDKEAIEAFQAALTLFENDRDLTQALAWLYFKTDQFRAGVALLEPALRRHGPDKGLSMTLATLYSSLYDYDQARDQYQTAIRLAQGERNSHFASIAWYNLSILETAFFHFDAAFEAIEASLGAQERASGALALGEAYQQRLDFAQALEAFARSEALDDTPLSRLSLARLYRQMGRLDEARRYLDSAWTHADPSWIYNFGLTFSRWQQDLHETAMQIHQGLAARAALKPKLLPWDWPAWLWESLANQVQAWYHEQRFRDLSRKNAEEALGGDNAAVGYWSLFQATKSLPWIARHHLARAKALELPLVPGAAGQYAKEEALLNPSPVRLAEALSGLDPVWQGGDQEELWAAFARQAPNDQNRRRALNQMYARNPGSLELQGWSLPLRVLLAPPAASGDRASWPEDLPWRLGLWAFSTGRELHFEAAPEVIYELTLEPGVEAQT